MNQINNNATTARVVIGRTKQSARVFLWNFLDAFIASNDTFKTGGDLVISSQDGKIGFHAEVDGVKYKLLKANPANTAEVMRSEKVSQEGFAKFLKLAQEVLWGLRINDEIRVFPDPLAMAMDDPVIMVITRSSAANDRGGERLFGELPDFTVIGDEGGIVDFATGPDEVLGQFIVGTVSSRPENRRLPDNYEILI